MCAISIDEAWIFWRAQACVCVCLAVAIRCTGYTRFPPLLGQLASVCCLVYDMLEMAVDLCATYPDARVSAHLSFKTTNV
mmetsp:Transcript_2644/g.6138  ORF Transcript_2644/g.6138 Transcript_2644/m.6138 type:complete len:80 (-) Transcript_2644:124-363(-)